VGDGSRSASPFDRRRLTSHDHALELQHVALETEIHGALVARHRPGGAPIADVAGRNSHLPGGRAETVAALRARHRRLRRTFDRYGRPDQRHGTTGDGHRTGDLARLAPRYLRQRDHDGDCEYRQTSPHSASEMR
jgi:hypothetical protein